MRDHESKLKDLLKNFSEQGHLKVKLLNKRIEIIWKERYKSIAVYTTKVQFKDGQLAVWVSSAPLRYELNLKKVQIILQLNEALKENLIVRLDIR
ncbi:MAG: DciA family protein [Saprospiraceae bacterium]